MELQLNQEVIKTAAEHDDFRVEQVDQIGHRDPGPFGDGVLGLYEIFIKRLNDNLPSRLRAGSTSLVSTIGQTVSLPLILLFGFWADSYSIFSAAIILVIVAFLLLTLTPRILSEQLNKNQRA